MRSWKQRGLKRNKTKTTKNLGRDENSNISPNATMSSFLVKEIGHKLCHQHCEHNWRIGQRNTFIFSVTLLKCSPRHACQQLHINLNDKLSSKPAHPNSTLHLSRKKSIFLHVVKLPPSSGEADMFLTTLCIILQTFQQLTLQKNPAI